MRVALVHDWLTGLRGGEKVLEVLCELFPEATLYTLVYVKGTVNDKIEAMPIRTAFTQNLPAASHIYRWYLPLYPWAIESIRLDGFDLVISSSHCVAKGVIPPKGAVHICYCHTPMRYVWDRFEDYFGNGLAAKMFYGPIATKLRQWDASTADRVDYFVANSRYVETRINNYYERDVSSVIPPPVDTDFFVPGERSTTPYYLIVSALVPYKKIELAVETFRTRSDLLWIVGTGPLAKQLEHNAPKNVRFLGWVTPEELLALYQGARACILPGVEDFGIVPLEAQACGVPTLALREGGALDTVNEGKSGIFFDKPTVASLNQGIDKIASIQFDKAYLREWSLHFSREAFRDRIRTFIETCAAQRIS